MDAPWKTRTAAYTPIFVFAVGTKVVLKVAIVDMNVAQAKLSVTGEHRLFFHRTSVERPEWRTFGSVNRSFRNIYLIPVVTAT